MIRHWERIILVFAAIIVVALALNWAVTSSIHYQKNLLVPDLTKKNISEALDTLSAMNLGIKKDGTEFDETVAANTVLRQYPAAGSQVREGKIIRVTLSQGNAIILMPGLIGQSLRAAEISLRNNLLSVGEVKSRPSLRYEKDAVIEQLPSAQSVMKRNDPVQLTVSEGLPLDGSILMPDFTGKNYADADAWAKNNSMQIERKETVSTPAAKETVVSQSVSPDTILPPSSTIEIIVSMRSGAVSPSTIFKFEAPQDESAKTYSFVLIDSAGTRELWSGIVQPGFKQEVPLPISVGANAKIRIFANGILVEEKKL